MTSGFQRILSALQRQSWLAVVFVLVAVPGLATAQDYPNRVIRVVVPYAAGGAIDVTARIVVERLEALLKQTVIVENRPGAAGRIAAEYVARAEPDGYTLLYTAGADLTVLQNRPSVPEPVRNLTPIAAAVNPVAAVATRTGLGFDSMAGLLAYIKANPGKLTYGSIGPGSTQHLYGEYFKQEGYDMLQVPFNGMAPMMTALAGGQIDVAITNLAASLPLTSDGKINTLAVTQSESFAGAADIPPITKTMPGFPFPKPFFGYYGPPGLPSPIISKLSGEIGKVLALPEVKSRLAKLSIDPLVTSPEEFNVMVQETAKTFQKIIKSSDIQLQ